MATLVSAARAQRASGPARRARRVADALGGRYSTELGIDVDVGDAEIERWFLAATVFGTRISAAVAERTFGVLSAAGTSAASAPARPGPAPAAFVRLARLAAGCYTGRRDLESGLVRLALADHRRG